MRHYPLTVLFFAAMQAGMASFAQARGGAGPGVPSVQAPAGCPAVGGPADGVWFPNTNPRRAGHLAIYDPDGTRVLVFAGEMDDGVFQNDVWALSLNEDAPPAWIQIATRGDRPPVRTEHAGIYDPRRRRLIVFGGWNGGLLGDVWELSLADPPTWRRLDVPGGPSARCSHTAVYNWSGDRMIVFGGFDGTYRNDVWALSLSGEPAWTELQPVGSLPEPRANHVAVPARGGMWILGGYDGKSGPYCYFGCYNFDWRRIWFLGLGEPPMWNGLSWIDESLEGIGVEGPTATLDGSQANILLFGGSFRFGDVGPHLQKGLIEVNVDTGFQASITASDGPRDGVMDHSAVYDPVRDRMIVFGGRGEYGNIHGEGYALEMRSGRPRWRSLFAPPPGPAVGFRAVYDPVGDRVIAFGGGLYGGIGDTWELPFGETRAWKRLELEGPKPALFEGHSLAHDTKRNRLLLFGGNDIYARRLLNDVWQLELDHPSRWSRLELEGEAPLPRRFHSAVYDPVRDRMIIFGGQTVEEFASDTWELRLGGTPHWSRLVAGGSTITPRVRHAAIYDPIGDRMIVMGGDTPTHDDPGEIWSLSLDGTPTWSRLNDGSSGPGGRQDPTLAFDPAHERMVLLGGHAGYFRPFNDAWEFPLLPAKGEWRRLNAANGPSPNWIAHCGVYATKRDELVAWNGRDLWTLSWGEPVQVVDVEVEPGTSEHPIRRPRHGTLRVAILGSSRFDASQIDPGSVCVGGAVPSVPGRRTGTVLIDVNHDGFRDLVVHVGAAGLGSLDSLVALRVDARTRSGQRVRGWDRFRLVGSGWAGVRTAEPVAVVGPRFALRNARTGTNGRQLRVWFSLEDAGAGWIELFDIQGRRLTKGSIAGLGPGFHTVELSVGAGLRPGLYLVRLTQGSEAATCKVAVIQ